MRPGLSTTVALVAAVLGTAAVGLASQSAPQFRAATELTRLELTVLDKRTRQPIKGLKASDFVVKVNGDLQPVETLAEVAVSDTRHTGAPAFSDAAHDVSTNTAPLKRLFVIIMNDASGGNDPFDRKTGKDIARAIVGGLGPEDMASVIFTRDNRQPQDFTADRFLLLQAIERFNPIFTTGIDPFSVVRRSQDFLAATPGYRRAIVFITPLIGGGNIRSDEDLSTFGIAEDAAQAEREMRAIKTGAQVAHVPIYPFSTHGLHAPTAYDLKTGTLGAAAGRSDEALRTVAGLTGGRATVANNEPQRLVPAMFEELSSYYALGFRQTYPLDGKPRWLQVQVRHPDAMVMPDGVPIATTKALAAVGNTPSLPKNSGSGFAEALGSPVPFGALPLRLSSVPLALSAKREQALALTLALPSVPDGDRQQFRVRLLLFDGEGRRQLMSQSQDVTITGTTGTSDQGTEIALRLHHRPGRYNLRIVAEQLGTKVAGAIHTTVTIPDFAAEPLSLSGVAIGRAEGLPIGGREALSDLLPFAPTAIRSFAAADHVGALLRIHQGLRRQAQLVTLETHIIDAGGQAVVTSSRTLTAANFSGGVAEHRYELPLKSLEPGPYLLRFSAVAGASRIQRDVRFQITDSRVPILR